MRLEGLDLAAATARAQAARPIIDPIHYLSFLLTQLEQALDTERLRQGKAGAQQWTAVSSKTVP